MEELELDPINLPQPLDWSAIFGNANPVEIEIGFGKGRFLIRSAFENPGKNYLGIDRSNKCLRITQERILKCGLKNVRVMVAFAEHLVSHFIPGNSISAYHIYFPDPWPKKRHAKRRLFKESFIVQLERTLIPGGRLNLATDVQSYYESMLELTSIYTRLRVQSSQVPDFRLDTNFENKYLKEGRPIYYACFEKMH
jgi:tRNA (guanine-N7-)-methyltransferase